MLTNFKVCGIIIPIEVGMKKIKVIGSIIFACASAGFVATMAAGCSYQELERAGALGDKLTSVIVAIDDDVKDFELIGTDVNKSGFTFDLSFNGVASLNDNSKAFTTIKYEASSSLFAELNKRSNADSVYDVFDYVVDNLSVKDYSITKVNNIKRFNDLMVKNTPSPFEGYKVREGVVYNISPLEFDDENSAVSFDANVLVNLRKGKIQPGFGLAIGFKGGVGIGLGLFYTRCEGTFMLIDKYTVNMSEQDYLLAKENPDFVFDLVEDSIANQNDENLSVSRVSTNDVTYDSADVLDYLNFNQMVDEIEM